MLVRPVRTMLGPGPWPPLLSTAQAFGAVAEQRVGQGSVRRMRRPMLCHFDGTLLIHPPGTARAPGLFSFSDRGGKKKTIIIVRTVHSRILWQQQHPHSLKGTYLYHQMLIIACYGTGLIDGRLACMSAAA